MKVSSYGNGNDVRIVIGSRLWCQDLDVTRGLQTKPAS